MRNVAYMSQPSLVPARVYTATVGILVGLALVALAVALRPQIKHYPCYPMEDVSSPLPICPPARPDNARSEVARGNLRASHLRETSDKEPAKRDSAHQVAAPHGKGRTDEVEVQEGRQKRTEDKATHEGKAQAANRTVANTTSSRRPSSSSTTTQTKTTTVTLTTTTRTVAEEGGANKTAVVTKQRATHSHSNSTDKACDGDTCPCHTAVHGETCWFTVDWAMRTGIRKHPDWYKGLTNSSTFEQFQEHIYKYNDGKENNCSRPCAGNIVVSLQ
mmetsp:Transcript_118362/g.330126  ORF Transcript_118362/g.330126 Transcript_118362/m.330126 type:complete len:274 (-) Transcript_118362:166-987(-)